MRWVRLRLRQSTMFLNRWRQMARMRHHLQSQGAKISPEAIVFGWRGVSLGSDTLVYSRATLACSSMRFEDAFDTTPQGSISIGKRCFVMSEVLLATYGGRISVGDDVSFNPGVIIYGHGGVNIGNKTRIAARSLIVSANHNFADPEIPIMNQGLTCKGVEIGTNVWIGAHVVIVDGVTIGDGCVIAAGSVVTRSMPSLSVVAGVPAKVINSRPAAGCIHQGNQNSTSSDVE
jgi:acetyltransferase-like isoleucine patch superfamily enzyme